MLVIDMPENNEMPVESEGPVIDLASDTKEKQIFREALQNMGKNEIMRIPEDRFRELLQWIITDTAFILREPSEHRVLMVYIAGEYPQWHDAFLERFGGRF